MINLRDQTFGVAGDDSATIDIGAGDTLYIQGGTNVTTSTNSDGTITINSTASGGASLGDLQVGTFGSLSNQTFLNPSVTDANLLLSGNNAGVVAVNDSLHVQSSASGIETYNTSVQTPNKLQYTGVNSNGNTWKYTIASGTDTSQHETTIQLLARSVLLNQNINTDIIAPGGNGDFRIQNGGDAGTKGVSVTSVGHNHITLTDNNDGEIVISPKTGKWVEIDGLRFPTADGTAGQVLKTNGSGILSFADDTGGTSAAGIRVTGDDSAGIDIADGGTLYIQGGTNVTTSTNSDGTITINATDSTLNLIDEDNFSTNSNTRPPSQQSVKAYVDAQVATKDNSDEITEGSTNLYFTNARADARITNALKDEDNMASNSDTHVPSQQSVKAYVDAEVSGAGGGGVTVQDEGSGLSTTATTLNFVGAGVAATGTGATKTITIAGGGGSASTGDITFSGNELSTGSSNADLELTANGTGSINIQPRGGIADMQANIFESASTSLSRGAGLPNIFGVAAAHPNGTRGYKYDSMYFKLTGSDTSSSNARYRHAQNLTVDYNGLDSTNSGSSRGARMTNNIVTTNSSSHPITVGNHGGFSIWSQIGDDEGGNSKGDVAATNSIGLSVNTAAVTASGQTVSISNLTGIRNSFSCYGDGTETIGNLTAFDQQIYNQTTTGNVIGANLIYQNGTVGGNYTGLHINSDSTNTTGTALDIHCASDTAQSNLNNLIIGDDGNGSDKIIKTANSGDNIKIQTQGAGDVIIEPGQDQSDNSNNDTASTVFADRFRHREAFYEDGTHSGSHTPDINNGNVQTITLGGDITINSISNIARGHSITLILIQDGTGGRSLTSTMKFAGGAKTLTPAANAIDVMSVFYTGSTYIASLSTNFA